MGCQETQNVILSNSEADISKLQQQMTLST